MFFSNSYIQFSNNMDITSRNNINSMSYFIKKYIIKMSSDNKNNQIYEDALIYSKYYLHYKILNCIYTDDIMNILLNIET